MPENIEDQWEFDIFQLDSIRKMKKITHQEIADALGMQQSNVAKFFSAKNRPNYNLMKNISGALDTKILLKAPTDIDMDIVHQEAITRMLIHDNKIFNIYNHEEPN